MSDCFYRMVRGIGSQVMWLSSAPVVRGLEHIPREGPCIIASNHTSPYDVALLIYHIPRLMDFVSITEVFENRLVGWFYGSMNAFPLDRSRPDAPTVRTILERLERGRVVSMFPEGGFRRGMASVVHSGKIRPGIGRIARIAGVPIVPAVVVNSRVYGRPAAWLPIQRTCYGLAIDRPIMPDDEAEVLETRLVEALQRLHRELTPLLPEKCRAL
jgi:1-acyl-sn-glycerol-3-phosphate acyltransferase